MTNETTTTESTTPFERAISTNISHTIYRALKDGTCGMSRRCLQQCTRTPSALLEGSPDGEKAPFGHQGDEKPGRGADCNCPPCAYSRIFQKVVDTFGSPGKHPQSASSRIGKRNFEIYSLDVA